MSGPLTETSVQALGWMLLHFVWQGAAAAAVLAASRVLIKAPGLRYVTACTALLMMVLAPLLSRIKRLLVLDGPGTRGVPSFTVLSLVGVLAVLALTAVTLEAAQVEKQTEEEGMVSESEEVPASKVLDVNPTANISFAVGPLHDMLQEAGHSEWSTARLQGVLGNAFSFEMREGAPKVWQEANLDGWLVVEILPELDLGCRIQIFQVRQRDEEGDHGGLKAAAWEAVRESIDHGIPAVAWSPMSRRQKAEGLKAHSWGLLTGYDESDETYTVRHQYVDEAFTVRYDAIGHIYDVEWFCVLVYGEAEPVEASSAHVKALHNAVAFANGTRYDPKEEVYSVDARGFAAFELWRKAIESGAGAPDHSWYNAGEVRALRGYAATYLRELIEVFPAARSDLEEAAGHYDRSVETANKLADLCRKAWESHEFPKNTRAEAGALVADVLQEERAAIARIEAAIGMIEQR